MTTTTDRLPDRRHRRRRQDGHARLQQPREDRPHRLLRENSPAGQERVDCDAGRELTDTDAAVADADVVVLAVPDLALQAVYRRPSCRR